MSLATAKTRLQPGGWGGQQYGSFAKTILAGDHTGGPFTRLTAIGGAQRVTFVAKTSSSGEDYTRTDSLVLVINDGPVTDVDIDVSDVMQMRITEGRQVGQTRFVIDTLNLRSTDTVASIVKTNDTARAGSDSLVPVLTEAASIRVLLSVSDSLVPVLTEASSVAAGTAATGPVDHDDRQHRAVRAGHDHPGGERVGPAALCGRRGRDPLRDATQVRDSGGVHLNEGVTIKVREVWHLYKWDADKLPDGEAPDPTKINAADHPACAEIWEMAEGEPARMIYKRTD
jgi:hypothetical protein